jgi:hypothetical protein
LFVPIKERINIMNKSEPKLDKESELSTGDFDGGEGIIFG